MLSYCEKKDIDNYLIDSTIAQQISFDIQKDIIKEKYPNAIFGKENQSLYEYVYTIISKLPFRLRMAKNGYLNEALMLLYEYENHYLASCTKEIYPTIGKNHAVNSNNVERSLRYFITKEFSNILQPIKKEYFSVPDGMIPTNFYFLSNLAEYIKTHYFGETKFNLTLAQQEYFLSHLKKEDNALYIVEQSQKRKEIENFLYEQLGFFRNQACFSAFMLTDMILYCIDNDIYSFQDFYENSYFHDKWQIYDYEDFRNKLNAIAFIIANAYKNINPKIYEEIFGDIALHRALLKYILTVSGYLKEQEYTRCLTANHI